MERKGKVEIGGEGEGKGEGGERGLYLKTGDDERGSVRTSIR